MTQPHGNSDNTIHAIANYVATNLQSMLSNNLQPNIGQAFYVWVRKDRLIISVDPLAVKSIDKVLSERFRHHLSTVLSGRKVVVTNSRGIFYQISFWPQPATILQSKPLDLSEQPGQDYVPIGITKSGPLWLSITELDSVLIGGSRGMGKSTLLHAWIQALLNGKSAKVYLWDGKDNAEFGRYKAQGAHAEPGLSTVLGQIYALIEQRKTKLMQAGFSSTKEYNEHSQLDQIEPIVLVIDEAAFIPEDCQETVIDLVARGRAWGVYPVLATQRPGVTEVQPLIKSNLTTRIAFPVPDVHTSQVILGKPGAEKLPRKPGALLFERGAQMVKSQAFSVSKPSMQSVNPQGTDLDIMRRAAQESENKLSIPLLMQWGMKEWTARQMLSEWQANGWLVTGKDNARYLSSRVLSMISQAAQPSQTFSNQEI